MKNKSDEKREQISSERRNFLRKRVIVQGYDDLWQADVEMRPYPRASIEATTILIVIVLSTREPYILSRARVEARWLTLSLRSFERVEDIRKIYKRI